MAIARSLKQYTAPSLAPLLPQLQLQKKRNTARLRKASRFNNQHGESEDCPALYGFIRGNAKYFFLLWICTDYKIILFQVFSRIQPARIQKYYFSLFVFGPGVYLANVNTEFFLLSFFYMHCFSPTSGKPRKVIFILT